MLSSLLRQGSFISQEWFCLSNCYRAKIIHFGAHPGDFCPHKLLHSSVLDLTAPAPFQEDSWSPLWQWSHFPETEKGSGSWGHSEGTKSLAEDEPVDVVPETPVWVFSLSPEWFLRCRGSTQIRAGIEIKCRNSCNSSKQGQDIRVHLNSWVPPTLQCCCWSEGPRKILQIWLTLTTATEWTLMEKDVRRCCMMGNPLALTERTSLV